MQQLAVVPPARCSTRKRLRDAALRSRVPQTFLGGLLIFVRGDHFVDKFIHHFFNHLGVD